MASKTNWADDVDAPAEVDSTSIDENGIKTVIEYKTNDKGQKIKVTRKIKRALVETQVNSAVAQRLALPKFGLATQKDNETTTTVGENIKVRLVAGGNKSAQKPEEEDATERMRAALAQTRTITCRICEGRHYTSRCPYKETFTGVLPGAEEPVGLGGDLPADAAAPGAVSSSGKYIPPSMRGGGAERKGGESMFKDSRSRDELPTLRVTNLSEDAQENDLREIFYRFEHFGKLARVFVGRDQETGLCKGFAFVSFEDKRDAEKAMGKVNGMPYDHLILACQWSVPREPGAGPPK